MIYIWSGSRHCHLIVSCFIKFQTGLTFLVPAYHGCPEKRPLNGRLSVCLDAMHSVIYVVVQWAHIEYKVSVQHGNSDNKNQHDL